MSRITGAALPAGLTDGERTAPDITRLHLESGDVVVMVSDGVADQREDQWLRDALAAFDGESPKDLARTLEAVDEALAEL